MGTQPLDDAAESAGKALELASGHRREEREREPLVVALELLHHFAPKLREMHTHCREMMRTHCGDASADPQPESRPLCA